MSISNDDLDWAELWEQSAIGYAVLRAKQFGNVNINDQENRSLIRDIYDCVNASFVSMDMIKIIKRGGLDSFDFGRAAWLVGAIAVPNPIDKLRSSMIKDALVMSVGGELYSVKDRKSYSKSEFNELMKAIADKIVYYSALAGDKRNDKTRAVLVKVLSLPFKPAMKMVQAPVAVLSTKWILAGIHTALVRYCINRDVFQTSHSEAMLEATKGYEYTLKHRTFLTAAGVASPFVNMM